MYIDGSCLENQNVTAETPAAWGMAIVAPLMVLFAWVMGVPLSLEFGILETAATFMSVLVANFILNDGKTNWLEGVMLLACYVILALSFFEV